MKPWEKYQSAQGPWAKYQSSQPDSSQPTQQQLQSDVPMMPEDVAKLTPEQQAQYYGTRPDKQYSPAEKAVGLAEQPLQLVANPILRTLGQTAGATAGLVHYLLHGDYSKSPQNDVTQSAEAGANMLTIPPLTEAGKQYTQTAANAIEPYASAAMAVAPMAGEMAALGSGLNQAAPAIQQAIQKTSTKIGNIPKTIQAQKMLKQAAPEISQLKESARAIYNKLDNAGVTIEQPKIASLASDIAKTAKKEGFNARIHPKVAAALDEISNSSSQNMTLSELDTMRRVARAAARSIEPDEARLGSIIVNKIDDFMNKLPESSLSGKADINIGPMYKQARDLWQRSKKSETIMDAVEKAKLQASGFENGLRTQFRSLLNNKKKMQGFTQDEKAAMRKVVQGGGAENTLKFLGKFGFSEGHATSMLGSSIGVAGGAAIGGAPGAVAVPLIGQVSKSLAQRLTRNNAQFADQIIRAGKNGKQIALAYVKNTPKSQRSAAELTQLLMRNGVDIESAKTASIPLIRDAAFYADLARFSAANSQNIKNSMGNASNDGNANNGAANQNK